MSHVVGSKVYVTDLNDAEAVGNELGFDLHRGATTHAWYGHWVGDFTGAAAAVSNGHDPKNFGKCEHKLTRKDHRDGMYEIGLVRRPDGKPGWELLYDNWGTGGKAIEDKAGVGLVTMKDKLAERVLSRAMLRQGYRIMRSVDAKGAVTLTAVK